jgi:hypothetical protein
VGSWLADEHDPCHSVGMHWLRTVGRWPLTWLVAAIGLAPAWLILLNEWGQANEKALGRGTPQPSCTLGPQGGFHCSATAGGANHDLLWAIILIILSLVCLTVALTIFGRTRPRREYIF